MSANVKPLDVVKTVDPIVRIDNKRVYSVLKGGAEVSYKSFISTSYSTSTTNFTCPPPNPGVIVNRKVYLYQPVRLTFTGTNALGGPLLVSGYDAFRAFPLSSVINVLNVTLNNTAVSINMSDVIQPLLRYNVDTKNKALDFSLTPSYMDQTQNYADLIGATKNPLASYAEGQDGDVPNRGSFRFRVVQNTATQAVIEAYLVEPLFLSPFLWGCQQKSGFIGLQNIDVNITYNANLNRMWSRVANASHPNNGLQTIAVDFFEAPQLRFNYITPPPTMLVPNEISYPYSDVQRYPTAGQAPVASNATVLISSNNIQLQNVPKKIYIWARIDNSQLTFNSTDTFFSIEKVSVNFNNRSGLLASASKTDLYNISKKNGCQLSWTQWSGEGMNTNLASLGTVGSVLCLEPALDIGLSPLEAPGMLESIQFQIDVQLKNVNQTTALTPVLYIATVSEGTFSVVSQRTITQVGVLTKTDILNADNAPQVSYDKYQMMLEGSGDFMSDLRWAFEEPWDRIVKPVGKELLPLALQGAKKLVGLGADDDMMYGDGGPMVGGVDVGGRMKGGVRSAGILVGGAKMSRKELKKRLNM